MPAVARHSIEHREQATVVEAAATAEPAAVSAAPQPLPGLAVPAPGRMLTVGAADDGAEVEADAVAGRVVDTLAGTPAPIGTGNASAAIARTVDPTAASADIGPAGGPLSDDLAARVIGAGGGKPLPGLVRRTMEHAMQADFGGVRVHTGPEATALNDRVQARAFTVGSDIYFRDGVPDVGRPDGQHLLAHELTHVTQQSTGDRSTGRRTLRRILQTRKQLETAVGAAKSDVSIGGKVVKAMGTRYKAVLKAVDGYHTLLDRPIAQKTVKTDIEMMDEFIERIEKACDAYLGDHTEGDERSTWIGELKAKAATERQVVATLGTSPANLVGKTWRAVLPKIGGESGGLVVPTGAVVEQRQNPGLEGKVVKATTMHAAFDSDSATLSGTKTPLKKNDTVIIHDTGKPGFSFVEAYESTGKLGEFKTKTSGYLGSADVKVGDTKHKAVARDEPIFTREPHEDDINQGAIGDCYLLAALGSVVKSTPALIYDMIKDNGDGTVTVRMFQPAGNAATAKYFALSKSVVDDARKSSGALWVALLEKAYATMGVGSAGNVSKSYAQIGDGGKADLALHIVTGRPPRAATDVMSTRLDSSPPWGAGQLNMAKQGKIAETKAYLTLYNNDLQRTTKFMEFATKNGAELNKFRTYEQFEALCTKDNLPAEVADPLLAAMRKQVPSKRGTGKYSTAQTDLYDQIEKHLRAGGYAAASTKKTIEVEKGGKHKKGHSGGEDAAEGLVGQHAYSLLAVREIKGPSDEPRKYVRLRNPWGRGSDSDSGGGRVYKELPDGTLDLETDPKVLAKKSKAEFDMELTDFTKHFDKVNWG